MEYGPVIPDDVKPLAILWAMSPGDDLMPTNIDDDLFTRAIEIRDQQANGVPLDWIADWQPWLASYHAWMAAHPEQPAPAAQPSLF